MPPCEECPDTMGRVFDSSAALGTCGESSTQLRVLVVDDHEVQRIGTRQVLETTEDIVVVAEAGDGNAAVALVGEVCPDIALIDIRLPNRDGIDVAREVAVHHRATRVIILSAYDDDKSVRGAQEAGVAGYLLKTLPRAELIRAIRAVALGLTVLDPSVSTRWADVRRSQNVAAAAHLTLRERQIVALVGEGRSNRAIADHLGVSVRTVEGHLNHVFAKVGLDGRTELVRFALTNGLSDAGPASNS
jgi:DNA-binding NarL/FixJ family response regulator